MANRRTLLPAVLVLISWIIGNVDTTRMRTLPKEFYFGVSTASYQVEGAWNVKGKGESIWDHLVHTLSSSVKDRTNADQACDSYHLYETDVQMLERLGVDFYRFSISWSRLLPTGFIDKLSQDGVDYYNKLINSLIERDIVPMVVLHHWDLPQPLQVLGGWPNVLMAEYFADFARTAFSLFGDRVRLWATFSQPELMCRQGYGGRELAPMLNTSGLAEYMCAHTVLLAHAKAYHIYDDDFRKKNGGMIGIIFHSYWSEPASKTYEDQRAAEQAFMFNFAWMSQPIFSSGGDYPKAMSKRIAARSSRQKFQRSRFPSFKPSEVRSLAGSADFLGLSHATTRMVRAAPTSFVVPENPSFEDDRGVDEFEFDRHRAPAAKWLKLSAKGFRSVLNYIRKEYRDPEVIVMGDGLETNGGLHDQERIAHMNHYLSTIWDAMEDGCNIKAYSAWSLMDGFNWLDGYTKKYGLYEVDFRSKNRTRTLRDSGKAYADIIKSRSFIYSDICSDCEDGKDLFDDYNSVENK